MADERMKIRILEAGEVDRLTTMEDWMSEFEETELLEMLCRYQNAQFNSKKYRQSEDGKEKAREIREKAKLKQEMMKRRLAELEAMMKEKEKAEAGQ